MKTLGTYSINEILPNPKIVTRVEIIDKNGRAFVDTKSTYTLSFQDNNKTLKLFKQETKCN